MKRILPNLKGVFALLLALSLGMGTAYAYDFSAVCSTGQTLYYNIIDATNHYVEITCPGTENDPWPAEFTKPSGPFVLPADVTHGGVIYAVTKIGDNAFYSCTGLTGSLTISNSVTSIGDFAFYLCSGFTGQLIIPNSVTTIGTCAFRNCTGFMGTLTIGSGVAFIGNQAFNICYNLTSMTVLPATPPFLGPDVFYSMPITTPVYVHCESLSAYQNATGWNSFLYIQCGPITFADSAVKAICVANWDTNGDGELSYAEAATVTSLGIVFQENYNITSFNELQYFTGVSAIEQSAFQNCIHLASITLPPFLSSIGYSAFYDCSALTSIVIPASVTSLEWTPFPFCTALESITMEAGPNNMYHCEGNAIIDINHTLVVGCKNTVIPDDVTAIGDGAFLGCSALTQIDIPSSVTQFGIRAFSYCEGLTSFTIPASVTSIDANAFTYCSGFTELTVLATTPPTLGTWVFGVNNFDIPVYVPCGSLEAYQAYDNGSPWGGFTNFQCLPYDDFPYVEDFETACDWQLINGNLTNKWVWGEASTRNNHYLYISDNNGASNHYTITSSTMVYAVKLFHFDEGWYRFKYDWLAYGEKNYDYLRVALVPASVTLSAGTTLPSGFSYQSLPSGWIALDGGHQLSKNAWWQTNFSEIYVPTGDYRMVFAWRNDSSVGNQPPAAIDNVSIRPVTCLAPVELTTRHVGSSKVFLDWTPVGNENEWEVWLSFYNGNETEYWPYPATTHPFTINGLESGRNYTATVNAICGPDNASFSSNEISFTTSTDPCDNPATFPFTENFDGYEGATSGSVNVLPNCWSRINTTTVSSQQGYPTITEYSYAQSAPNFLYFMSSYIVGSYEDPQDQYAILPPMDHMANLELSFSARIPAPGRNGTFMVGVMTDPTDASTFTEITTLQPTSTTYTQYTVPLDLYTGDGWYIAIKMPAASSSVNYRGLCIDNVTVNYDPLTYAINADDVSVTVTGHKDGTNASGELVIPSTKTIDGVTYTVNAIGDYAFFYCNGLTGSLTIPNTVTSIGIGAFEECSGFNGNLTIGNSVTSIGNFAFRYCSGFTGSLTIPNSVTTIGDEAFEDCTGFTGSLIIPNSMTSIRFAVFRGCTGFTGSLTIPNSVTTIGNDAFCRCSGLTGSLIIPNSVTSIGYRAFNGCSGFTGTLSIPNSVTYIDWGAFMDCSGFTGSLTIPNSLTSIPHEAFRGCSGFTGTLTIGNSVTNIVAEAFSGCSGFTGDLTIPNSVTSIGYCAFNGCSGFTGTLSIPNSVTYIDWGAFRDCSGITGSLTIPNSVTTIYVFTFEGCTGLTGSLTIPNSVTSIDYCAFNGCSGITSITALPETPPTMGTNALSGIPTTIPVYVPCASLEDYQSASGWSRFTNMQCIPETLTVYDGTASNDYVPVYGYYADAYLKAEFVMPAAELADMAGGTISNMKFYASQSNVSWGIANFQVFLTEVADATISAFAGPGTVVYQGALSIVNGEMTVNFTTPYQYNGGNLLVGIYNSVKGTWATSTWYGETVNGASVQGYNSSSLEAVTPTQQNFIPKTTFSYTPSECSRPNGLTVTDITNVSARLSWNGYQDSYDLRYRKKTYFFEDFENGLPSDWTAIDNDGDGYNWHSVVNYSSSCCHSGSTIMASASYDNDNSTVLTPDNWLITPQLELQGAMKVWIRALHPNYAQEHFAIYLSTTGNSVSDFTTVLVPETTLTDVVYRAYTADLSAYEGQQGYIAIRHFNCSDMYEILLDDFGLFDDPNETGEWETLYEVGSNYILTTLEPITEYEWQVRGRDCDGEGTYSEWSSVHNFTTLLCAPEDQCELTFTLNDSYGDGWNGAAIRVVDVETNTLIASMSAQHHGGFNMPSTDTLTLAVCDGRELRFEWMSGSYDSECSYIVTDINGNEVFSGYGAMSEPFNYIVDCSLQYVFLTNGNWNNDGCWSTGTVPPAGSDVIIQANVTVPAGCLAVANAVTLDGGSITVADGGQLKHNTMDLVVTMKKNIAGYDDANSQNNYYLLAVPFLSVQVPTAMTANPGSDFYRFDPSETGAEWRNHKEEPITFVQRRYGYLYANPESVELSLTGITLSVSNEFTMSYTVDYTEGSSNPSNGWALLGNPFTYNAYVYRFDSNNEFVPMPIMMYDEEGELQTIYGGPVAPMQGFFVHVTETTTVYFSGTALHEDDYVDLGLPSGLLWATCNVGANAPEEYGDYFAWGETQPKDTYSEENYTYSENPAILPSNHDAATANWGPDWRMPTKEEWEELYSNTTVTRTQQNGVVGCLFTSANGNSLFLPAAGSLDDSGLYAAGSNGYYWSSSLDTGDPYYAWELYFYSDDYGMYNTYRDRGQCVRPVRSASQN